MADKGKDLRMRSGAVLWRLEQSIGALVKELTESGESLPDGPVNKITRGDLKNQNAVSTTELVAASYLDEVLDLAVGTAEGRAIQEPLEDLRSLIKALDLYTVRNAIAHPNRPFHDTYWYRVAVVATDAAVDRLGFEAVSNSFSAALEGKFTKPPDQWIEGPRWQLPNNLPNTYDYEITGFFGRKDERGKIRNRLRNPKSHALAVVAPGGVGKTALILKVLDDLVKDPDSLEWIDEVIYVSAKTEILTTDGVESLDTPAETIAGLKKAIARELMEAHPDEDVSFEEAKAKAQETRLLLCIDNLETLLRDEAEQVESFYFELPESWEVVVTSRVSVDFANTITLKNFDEQEAIPLAWNYLSKRGYEEIDRNDVERIINVAGANPLAIKLSIDNLVSGGSLDDALSQTQHDVVEFSYSNLVDHLPAIAKEVLESLFKAPEPISRIEVAKLLDKSVDEVAEGFNRLIHTSLCSRISTEDEEKYELSSSVRDLLLINPANANVRGEIEERRRSMKLSVFESKLRQNRAGQNPLSLSFLSGDIPQHVRATAYDAIKTLTSKRLDRRRTHESYKQIKEIIGETSQHAELYRIAGLLLIDLDARQEGKQLLEKAISGEHFDPAAALSLCIKYREDKELEKAIQVGEKLIADGWNDPLKGRNLARDVIKGYFLPRIWAGEYEDVIEETRDWNEQGAQSKTYGSLHAQALRNYAGKCNKHEEKAESIVEALSVVDALLKAKGYAGYLVVEGAHLIERASMLYVDSETVKSNLELISSFVDRHLANIASVHRDIEIDDELVKNWVRKIHGMKPHTQNRLRDDKWTSYVRNELSNAVDENSGPVMVTVKNRPRYSDGEIATFMFASSDFGSKDFFIHKDNISNIYDVDWRKISPGDRLEVIPGDKPQGESAHNVETATYLGEPS